MWHGRESLGGEKRRRGEESDDTLLHAVRQEEVGVQQCNVTRISVHCRLGSTERALAAVFLSPTHALMSAKVVFRITRAARVSSQGGIRQHRGLRCSHDECTQASEAAIGVGPTLGGGGLPEFREENQPSAGREARSIAGRCLKTGCFRSKDRNAAGQQNLGDAIQQFREPA